MSALDCDLFVIGAGPAGASCAWHAARAGLRVVVAEKSVFPRDKLCGDYLAPGCVEFLEQAGLAALVARSSPTILQGALLVHEGRPVPMSFPAGKPGWALGRRDLDAALLRASREAGALVHEGTRVVEVRERGGFVEIEASRGGSERLAFRAAILVDAGGRNAIVPRRRGWRRSSHWPVRYAVGAWFEGVRGLGPRVEMHVVREGYIGISPLSPDGPGRAGAAAVIPARLLAEAGLGAADLLQRLIRSSDGLRRRFAEARAVTPVRGAGPLAHRARSFAGGRSLLAGDAAGFVDPFTGEGIQAALRGGAMAAEAAAAVLNRGPAAQAAMAAGDYARSLSRMLAPRFALARILQGILCAPPLARRMAEVLERRPELADELVAVTGGLRPPSSLLRRGVLVPLLSLASSQARS